MGRAVDLRAEALTLLNDLDLVLLSEPLNVLFPLATQLKQLVFRSHVWIALMLILGPRVYNGTEDSLLLKLLLVELTILLNQLLA